MKNLIVLLACLVLSSCSLFEEEETDISALNEPDLDELGLESCYDACRDVVDMMAYFEIECTNAINGCDPNTHTTCHIVVPLKACESLCDGAGNSWSFAASEDDVDKCLEYLDSKDCDSEAYETPWDNEDCRSVFLDIDMPFEKPY